MDTLGHVVVLACCAAFFVILGSIAMTPRTNAHMEQCHLSGGAWLADSNLCIRRQP